MTPDKQNETAHSAEIKRKRPIYILNNKDELKRLESKFNPSVTLEQVQSFGFRNGQSFLDIGCGSGAMTRTVAVAYPQSRIIGVDVNKDFINYAKKVAQKERMKNVLYEQGDIYNLPFGNNSFDFVWARFLFEYLKHPLEALKEMKRVAKKGGIVVVGDLDGNCLFNYPINKELEDNLFITIELLKKHGFDPFVGRKLYNYFKKIGFEDIEIKIVPYHNIFGKPNRRILLNWQKKVQGITSFLKRRGAINFKKIGKQFLEHIKNENTFTYSVLIFAKGKKSNPAILNKKNGR